MKARQYIQCLSIAMLLGAITQSAQASEEPKKKPEVEKALAVEKGLGRTGSRGGIIQEKVQSQDDTNPNMVRNVKGSDKEGDVLNLLESEREARRLR